MNSKEILVSISLNNETIPVGTLWCHVRNSKESASFEYDQRWLDHPEKFSLEPALQLTTGSFHTKANINLFGAIGDSAPDRWGRVLMRRQEANHAKHENRASKTLFESDYLLGVNDEARQGALRFSLPPHEQKFLASSPKNAIPPLINLAKLLSATERFIERDENAADLKLLLAPGSSLGGARPKASIRDKDGSLTIAKFPRKDDEYNNVVWEAVALTLAQKAGINTPNWRLEKINDQSVLIIKRFDRNGQQRIPFLSAMSMLDAIDNEPHSYLEIAAALMQYGASPNEDLSQMWRRIVFTVLISNTDDHLRNHGFLYQSQGWRLSPAYDMNPTPIEIKSKVLSTSINYEDPTASLELALSVADDFRISKKIAQAIIAEVEHAVQQWQSVATHLGLSKREIDYMASAFTI